MENKSALFKIRRESPEDCKEVGRLVTKAFENAPYSNQTEHLIVERIRESDAFVPELSLVAELDGLLVGHILLSKVRIADEQQEFVSLSLAPVSVLPDYQKMGVGAALIQKAHQIAQEIGFPWVVLVGHADYYPRFGYQKSIDFGIKFPFESPPENCMVKALHKDGLKGVHGMVVYPRAFFE